jgi:replicative DNA helicase
MVHGLQKGLRQEPHPGSSHEQTSGVSYLPDKYDVPYHVEEMLYDYNQRQLVKTIKDAATYVAEGDNESAVMSLASYTQVHVNRPLPNALHDFSFLDSYEREDDLLSFPWRTLDELTGGMRGGQLYYWAARLGQGKSWSMAHIVAHALMCGRKVMFYSLEMSEEEVMTRIHVLLGRILGFDVDHMAMYRRRYDLIQYRKIVEAVREEVTGELWIQDTSKGVISPSTLMSNQAKEADLLVVDHVGLMHSGSGGRAIRDWRLMAEISNQLKEVALSTNARILAAAQINRAGDEASKWPPKVKYLSQSDALGQDADGVITHKRWGESTMCYSAEKTRNGVSEVNFWSKYEPNHGIFDEISRDDAEERRANEED